MKTCTLEGCNKPHRARGLCGTHYNQTHVKERHKKKLVACVWCGIEVEKATGGGRKYGAVCSLACRRFLQHPYCVLPEDHWARWYGRTSPYIPPRTTPLLTVEERGRAQRTNLRAAIEDGASGDVVIEALKLESSLNEAGCWVSNRTGKDGYPIYQMALKNGKTKSFRLHRIALEAKLGKPLGSQAAHHMCANSSCINPDHLQPISFRENTAEMMQRNYYIARIKELEAALASANPAHPLLQEVGLPEVA